ncbi:MAG: pantetheine-phosphate adenylyltransferase [Lachnospiraceae bacterium]|jgi:pantetheine-phosphate adenylyltransferase, bacterial|nr:pantetheine-phosphate adenylyltransferase [Lachnospiraceae bacterium]MCI8826008.1 pantetheine-phosphate adenylyltransferase [Lachnospiraceae bacterium]MCI9370548.1 pantetheine-phosphate adenylyltransferase [Lachnospiraceae bacterium]
MIRAIYPGSFDPVTLGHLDIIQRAARNFDELIVGVLNNQSKYPLFTVEERVKMLEEVSGKILNVKIMSFSGLLVDFARKEKANCIIRGLRAITDFEYELQMAQTNSILNSDIDTMFLTASNDYSYLSSTTVKEIASFGGNIEKFVPEEICNRIYEKYSGKR